MTSPLSATLGTTSAFASQRLGKRLARAAAVAHEHNSTLYSGRADIYLLKQERLHDRAMLHTKDMEAIKQVTSATVRAPGLEKTMSVKARLREIDAAARINASELHTRGHVLQAARAHRTASSTLSPSSSDPGLYFDPTASMLSGPVAFSPAHAEHERCRALPPVTGLGASDRMAKAVAQAKKLLESRTDFKEADMAWAEELVRRQQEREVGEQMASTSQQTRPAQMEQTSQAGLAKSASAPTLARTSPGATLLDTTRKKPRLKHDVLYPSMTVRCRVVEEHARRNAGHISTLTDGFR